MLDLLLLIALPTASPSPRCGYATEVVGDYFPVDRHGVLIKRIDVMTDRDGNSVAWVYTGTTGAQVIEGAPALTPQDAEILQVAADPTLRKASLITYNGKVPSDVTLSRCAADATIH